MHELAITQNLIEIARQHCEGCPVTRVRLEIGKLAGVMIDAIRFGFEVCCRDTPLEGCTLEIIEIEGRGHCEQCGLETEIDSLFASCPQCDQTPMRVIAGEELTIKEMEVRTCAEPVAAKAMGR